MSNIQYVYPFGPGVQHLGQPIGVPSKN